MQSILNFFLSFICSAVEIIFAKTENSLNVVKKDGFIFTTLHIAAAYNRCEIAKILLRRVIHLNLFQFFFRVRLVVRFKLS